MLKLWKKNVVIDSIKCLSQTNENDTHEVTRLNISLVSPQDWLMHV